MKEILQNLNRVKGIIGSLIVTKEGMLVVSDVSTEVDSDFVGALSASIVEISDKAFQDIQNEKFQMMIIEGETKLLIISRVKVGFLVVITRTNVNLGLVRIEVKKAMKLLENV